MNNTVLLTVRCFSHVLYIPAGIVRVHKVSYHKFPCTTGAKFHGELPLNTVAERVCTMLYSVCSMHKALFYFKHSLRNLLVNTFMYSFALHGMGSVCPCVHMQ